MMKKYSFWMASVLWALQVPVASGQFVTIPDPSFVNWLMLNGYGGCLSGNQLDTTCSQVTGATSINAVSQSISDLTGITYFDSLDTLICDQNQLTFLPDLPPALSSFCHGAGTRPPRRSRHRRWWSSGLGSRSRRTRRLWW